MSGQRSAGMGGIISRLKRMRGGRFELRSYLVLIDLGYRDAVVSQGKSGGVSESEVIEHGDLGIVFRNGFSLTRTV